MMIKKFLLFLTVCLAALDCVFLHREIVKKSSAPDPTPIMSKSSQVGLKGANRSHITLKNTIPEPTHTSKILLTAYFPSPNEDYWSNKRIGAKGDTLKSGVAAADFSKIPYGSKLRIKGINTIYSVLDTGTALITRKAARIRGLPRNVLVVDLFFNSESAANKFFENHSEICECSWE